MSHEITPEMAMHDAVKATYPKHREEVSARAVGLRGSVGRFGRRKQNGWLQGRTRHS